MILATQYCVYSSSDIWRTARSTTSRSLAPGACMSRTTGEFELQYWRSPRKIFLKSAIVKLVTGFSGFTTMATSGPVVVCAVDPEITMRPMSTARIARIPGFSDPLIALSSESEGGLEKEPVDDGIGR